MRTKAELNEMCKQKLRGKTISKGKRDEDVARALGITPVAYSNKINRPSKRFWDDQISMIADYLELTPHEVLEIFFPSVFRNLTKGA